LKDPGGLLTVDAVRELAPPLLRAAGERPLELHSHCTIGLAPQVYVEGVKAGFGTVHTAAGPLGRGASPPQARNTARTLEAAGYGPPLDSEQQELVAAHFAQIAAAKGLPVGAPLE